MKTEIKLKLFYSKLIDSMTQNEEFDKKIIQIIG